MFARVDQVHDYVWRGEGVRGISLVILLNELIDLNFLGGSSWALNLTPSLNQCIEKTCQRDSL